MKMPAIPPPWSSLFDDMTSADLAQALTQSRMIDDQGRYLHWDDLRFKPPPSGLTHRSWWAGTKMARTSAAAEIPLRDKYDRLFSYTEPPALKNILRYADTHAAGLLGATPHDLSGLEGKRYLRRSLAEEPFSSSYLEGAATTRDIAKKMIFEGRGPRTRDERMVLNNYEGMEFIKAHQDKELTPALILELHRIITNNTLDIADGSGRLRRADERIDAGDDSTGETLHMPPAADTLEKRLDDLCRFANADNDDKSYCHPLVRAIILHFMLAYDHPFVDGNGRTARALFYWSLLRSGYWLTEYISISSVITDSPTSYYRSFLLTETDHSDLTYFLLDQAATFHTALVRLHAYAEEKRREAQSFQKMMAEQNLQHPLNHRQIALLQEFSIRQLQETTVDQHSSHNGVTYQTARIDLEDLVSRKVLKKTRRGHSFFYAPQK